MDLQLDARDLAFPDEVRAFLSEALRPGLHEAEAGAIDLAPSPTCGRRSGAEDVAVRRVN